MEVFLSTIMCWAPNFAPTNWAFCQGQVMQIAQNSALFSLIKNTYGGDGITTFWLPNFAGRVLIGVGQAVGLPAYKIAETGDGNTTLVSDNLPAHGHAGGTLVAVQTVTTSVAGTVQAVATDSSILGAPNFPDSTSGGTIDVNAFAAGTATPTVPFKHPVSGATANTGVGKPFTALPPYIAMNWIIALDGIYPSQT